MTITGAGMWYTNIKFTNPNKEGGGISGGNGSHGPDGYSKKIEFCNMYINSALRSRMDQMAIYKCFMDVYTMAVTSMIYGKSTSNVVSGLVIITVRWIIAMV